MTIIKEDHKNTFPSLRETLFDMALPIGRRDNVQIWADLFSRRTRYPYEEVEVYVLFVNTTNRTLDLYWARESDAENIQLTLKPKEVVPVNTYNTHVWFFCDHYTGERMHVRSKRLFFPVRIRIPRNRQNPNDLRDVRSQVLIHFPLRTLKENCLWLIVRWLKRTCNSPEFFIIGSMIPHTLKQQLLQLLSTTNSYSRDEDHRRLNMIDHREWTIHRSN